MEVRYRPEALQALKEQKDRALEESFPLLSSGDGNGAEKAAQQPAANPLDALFGSGGGES
jgi:hypothetical protein